GGPEMATNPVFNRIDKEAQQYAGFNQAPQQGYGAPGPQGQPQMPMGYPGASESMSPEQLDQMYRQTPAGPAQTGRLTLDDVVMKSMSLFAIVLAVAAGTWFFVSGTTDPQTGQAPLAMPIWLLGMFGSLALSFVIGFSKKVNVPLILVHAVLQGLFIGAVSFTFNEMWPGVVTSAVVATMGTFAGMFIAWKVGFIKVT